MPETVTIFGGGIDGANYENSKITMKSGKITNIVGGGVSTKKDVISKVVNVDIEINGGKVINNVIGGGYLYAQVENSNITINNATIGAVAGGGMASVPIGGTSYNVGTKEKSQESENRVENTKITINSGTINSEVLGYGIVQGGGQGYSYTGTTKVILNGGDLSTSYFTAGGSNGYTKEANVTINDGNVNLFQSVNRGTVEKATVKVNGGTIEKFYIGGETEDETVTGSINKVETDILGGKITNLSEGKNNSESLIIDGENYSVVKSDSAQIDTDNIKTGEKTISYSINVFPKVVRIAKGSSLSIRPIVTTNPIGYEHLFLNSVKWNSSNENIVKITDGGIVTGTEERYSNSYSYFA